MSYYYAPRGRDRMYAMGMHLAQQYLSPSDKIIGIIGEILRIEARYVYVL